MTGKGCVKFPPKFPAKLLRPMPPVRRGMFDDINKWSGWGPEYLRALAVLCRHYGIRKLDKDVWPELCLHILKDLVPAFSEAAPRRVGAPIKPSGEKRQRLLSEVERMQTKDKELSDLGACNEIRWGSRTETKEFKREKVDTLRMWLRRARKERDFDRLWVAAGGTPASSSKKRNTKG